MPLLSITGLLLLGALVVAVLSGSGRAHLWIAVFLLALANLIALVGLH